MGTYCPNNAPRATGIIYLLLSFMCFPTKASTNTISFEQLVQRVLAHDKGIAQVSATHSAILEKKRAVDRLPDTEITLTAKNIPTGHWQINHDPMSHWQIGINQSFNRSGEVALKQRQQHYQAEAQPWVKANREAMLRWKLSEQWIYGYFANSRIQIISQSEQILAPLVQIIASSYRNALTHINQQDIIAAKLALLRLDERKLQWLQTQQAITTQLASWAISIESNNSQQQWQGNPLKLFEFQTTPQIVTADMQYSDRLLHHLHVTPLPNVTDRQSVYTALLGHPHALAQQHIIDSKALNSDLAKNKTKPRFGLNASYGARAENITGRNVDDLFSVGFKLSIPLFSGSAISSDYQSAIFETEANRTQRDLSIQQRYQRLSVLIAQIQGLQQRINLYAKQLVPQATQQAEAALNAYTSDNDDLSNALNAKLESLSLQLALLSLKEADLVYRAEVAYLLNNSTQAQANDLPQQRSITNQPNKNSQAHTTALYTPNHESHSVVIKRNRIKGSRDE